MAGNFVRKGSVSSSVGKYQIIRPTLLGLVQELNLDTRTRFDESLQDKLAITLLERRSAHAFATKKLTREQFAANLAKEWAALPKDLPPKSTAHYYFVLWDYDGTLQRIHHALYVAVREGEGREASPSAAVIDSQSARAARSRTAACSGSPAASSVRPSSASAANRSLSTASAGTASA